MAFVWEPLATIGVLALVLGWVGGALVYAVAPRRATNRLLALIFVLEGTAVGLARGVDPMIDDPATSLHLSAVIVLCFALGTPAYWLLYSRLDSRFARLLRARAPTVAVFVLSAAGFAWFLAHPEEVVAASLWGLRAWAAFGLLGLAVAITGLREAEPGTRKRRQAKAYVLAFGIRDASWFLYIWWLYPSYGAVPAMRPLFAVLAPLITICFIGLLAYGILSVQLFDLDLRLKRSVRAGTVASAFIVAYVLVSLASQAFVDAGTSRAIGVGAMVLLLFALIPLRRLGDTVASRAFPGLAGTPQYIDARKREVYRAAVEQAVGADARVAPQEEALLRELRARLGLDERDHADALRAAQQRGASIAIAEGGLLIGRYQIERELGRGGGGTVYLCRDTRTNEPVALKRLAGELRRNAEALARSEREMRLAGALHHPNVVAVRDVEVVGEEAFLVMEYVPGGDLASRLRAGPLPEAEALRVTRDVLAALDAVHAKSIVHLDVKPSNILLTIDGRAKLTDFTVAREVISGETIGVGRAGPVGTPAYMSPEQARGLRGTARSDIYAVGATLYAALSGRPPIRVEGLSEHEALRRVIDERPELPLRHVSAATNEALLRALAKDPERRFATPTEMANALGATPAGTPDGSDRPRSHHPA